MSIKLLLKCLRLFNKTTCTVCLKQFSDVKVISKKFDPFSKIHYRLFTISFELLFCLFYFPFSGAL